MFELLVLLISSIANILLGFIVYVKNPASATNKLFLTLTTSFAAWSVVNYISVHPVGLSQLWWIRLVLFFATFLCLSVYMTFRVFPHFALPPSRFASKLAITATIVVMLLTLSPFVFKGLKIQNGNTQPIPNFAIVLFAGTVFSLLASGVWTLI